MGRFAGLKEKHLSLRTSKIPNLDNGTMVEAFKYLNYRQLATNSLVSKRFRNVIETHRHKMALLFVTIRMEKRIGNGPAVIKIFNKELSPKEYNEWRAQNNYSKRISHKSQAANNGYELSAYGKYNGPNQERTQVFFAVVKELNHKTWALFQHFVCLLSDPFVYIRDVKLTPQADVFNFLAATIDRKIIGRLQCGKLEFDFEDNVFEDKAFSWIKGHMQCAQFQIRISNNATRDKELLDLFATGSDCTYEVVVRNCDISKDVVIDFVQKFMDLKSCDESQTVPYIHAMISEMSAEALKSNYAKFFMKEVHRYGWTTSHVFEFVNIDTEQKLYLTVTTQMSFGDDTYGEGLYRSDSLDIVIL